MAIETGEVILEVAVAQGSGNGSRGHEREPEHPMTVLEQGSLRKSPCAGGRQWCCLHEGKTSAKDTEGGDIS